MRGALGEHHEFERHRRQRDQIEPAIGVIGREQPVEAQHRREQRRDPDNAGADPPQHLGLGSDAERKQHDGQHKKPENEPDVAALPQAPAAGRGGTGREAASFPNRKRRRSAARAKPSSASDSAPSSAIGGWVATTTRPPAARCAAISVRAAPRHRCRARSSARRAARAAPAPRIGGPAPAAAAARPTTSGTASRRSPRARRRRARLDGRPRRRCAAQRRPEDQRLARGQRRLQSHRDGRHNGARAIAPARSCPTGAPPQMSRPAAGASSVATSRSRLDLPLPLRRSGPARRRAGRRQSRPGKNQPLAAPASELLGDQARRRSASPAVHQQREPARTPGSGVARLQAKKRLRRGNSGAALAAGRYVRPRTRFGGQTCKDRPYAYIWGGGLGLRFEKSVTFW